MMHFEHIREATKVREIKSNDYDRKINFERWYPNEEARKEAERKEKVKKAMCGEISLSELGFVPYKK